MINLERLERSRQGEGESQAENRVEIKMTAQPRTCHTALFHPHTAAFQISHILPLSQWTMINVLTFYTRQKKMYGLKGF